MATITITIPGPSAQRVASAFGKKLRLRNPDGTPRDATLAEVKEQLVALLRQVVRGQEVAEAIHAAQNTVPGMDDIT